MDRLHYCTDSVDSTVVVSVMYPAVCHHPLVPRLCWDIVTILLLSCKHQGRDTTRCKSDYTPSYIRHNISVILSKSPGHPADQFNDITHASSARLRSSSRNPRPGVITNPTYALVDDRDQRVVSSELILI